MRRTYETAYLRIIRDGIEKGQLRRVDPYLLYQMILSSLRGLHLPGAKKVKKTEDQLNEEITTIIIKGIAL